MEHGGAGSYGKGHERDKEQIDTTFSGLFLTIESNLARYALLW